MTEHQFVTSLIVVLEHAHQRPLMYCSNVDTADSFLRGIQIAMNLYIGNIPEHKIRGQVIVERGWTWSSLLPWDEMRRTGMDEIQIITEMFSVELQVWRRVATILSEDNQS